MDKLRISSALVLAVTILSACGSGGSSNQSTGPSADGGSLSDAGVTACTAAPSGTCSSGGAFCGALGCCPAGGGAFACSATGKCYLTQAEAIAACGGSCVACTTGGGLTDGGLTDAGAADAGPGANCTQSPCTCPSGSGPYACELTRTCYTTQAAAQAACGNSCLLYTGGGGTDGGAGGRCSTAPAGSCTRDGYVYCGGTSCCPSDFPFDCPSTQSCYRTEAAALAACPQSCVACTSGGGTDGGTDGGSATSCNPAPAGTCPGSGLTYCGNQICCPVAFPFNCPQTNTCYSTQEGALEGCGASCNACGAGGGGTDGGTGGTCKEAPAGQCSGTGFVFCGGTDCCSAQFPYTCPSSPKCFKTPEEAIAACGSDPCVHCH